MVRLGFQNRSDLGLKQNLPFVDGHQTVFTGRHLRVPLDIIWGSPGTTHQNKKPGKWLDPFSRLRFSGAAHVTTIKPVGIPSTIESADRRLF